MNAEREGKKKKKVMALTDVAMRSGEGEGSVPGVGQKPGRVVQGFEQSAGHPTTFPRGQFHPRVPLVVLQKVAAHLHRRLKRGNDERRL